MKGSDRLNLQVTDFGPIVKANVDLRPFTLFIGPSNMGKSYLAILIYALHERFGHYSLSFPYIPGGPSVWYPPRHLEIGPKDKAPLSDHDLHHFIEWAQQLSSEAEKVPNPLPEQIAPLIRKRLESRSVSDKLAETNLARMFGLKTPSDLIRRPSSAMAHIVLRRFVEAEMKDERPFEHKLDISKQEPDLFSRPVHLSVSIPAEKPLYFEETRLERVIWERLTLGNDSHTQEKRRFAHRIINVLADGVCPHIFGSVSSPAHYFPAARTGIMHAYNVIVSTLIERAAIAGIHPTTPLPMFPGVLADFLERLRILGERRGKRRSGIETLATKLERTVLGGTVRLKNGPVWENHQSITFRPKGWKEGLPLMHASSMVTELAPLVLFLRHIVRPGDVLIIEEPEAHLHPGMQVEFTRILASAIRNGIRIIVTTHSEWILEELANLVSASTLSKDKQETLGVADFALEESEVGSWLFLPKKRPKGSIVKEVKLDPESGTFASGFDDVAAALHNRWADISSFSE